MTLPTRLSLRLRRLARQKVPLHFVFAEGELGLVMLRKEGGQALAQSVQSGLICIHELAGGNHTFSDSEPYQRLIKLLHQLVPPQIAMPQESRSNQGVACSSPSA